MTEVLIIRLIVMFVFGAIAAAIANSKGRSAVGWFFAGFFLTLIGVIIAAVMPNLKEQRLKEEAMERENRRLREQLMQEQIKSEAFRQHAAARLDAHDVHLGVDTRAVVTALPSPENPAALTSPELLTLPTLSSDSWPNEAAPANPFDALVPVSGSLVSPAAGNGAGFPPAPTAAASTAQRQWYYEVHGKAQGPISDTDIVRLAQQGLIDESTLVWTQQLANWKPAGSIKSLKQYLKS